MSDQNQKNKKALKILDQVVDFGNPSHKNDSQQQRLEKVVKKLKEITQRIDQLSSRF